MNDEEIREQVEYGRRRAARRTARRKKRRREMWMKRIFFLFCMTVLIILIFFVLHFFKSRKEEPVMNETPAPEKIVDTPPEYDVQLLSVNEYSRPGTLLEEVRGAVVHYTANPGTTAQQNRDYFEGLSQSGETYASSHFVIGLEGELIQCIPCQEIAYASNERNADTISIECCIPDESGKFSDPAYDTLVHLLAWLMGRYNFAIDDIVRHYDVTQKACPKYYVEHPDAWEKLKADVLAYIETYGTLEESHNEAEE